MEVRWLNKSGALNAHVCLVVQVGEAAAKRNKETFYFTSNKKKISFKDSK